MNRVHTTPRQKDLFRHEKDKDTVPNGALDSVVPTIPAGNV